MRRPISALSAVATIVATIVATTVVATVVARGAAAQDPSVAPPVADGVAERALQLAADVRHLASPELGGRESGSAGGDSAAAFLARRYQALGVPGAFPGRCSVGVCPASWFQLFEGAVGTAQNVAAVVAGTDSLLRDEYVVVGAHYDHIGFGAASALDPERGSALRPGADDNASGTAAVLELARRLAERPARRSVLFVHFDAEEAGLVGSSVFVDHAPVPLRSVALMVNLDMVGRLRGRRLYAQAEPWKPTLGAAVTAAAAASGLVVARTSRLARRSDQASFARRRVPVVVLFTGEHADYHRATDVAERVNVPGLLLVTDVAERIVRAAADGARTR